MTCLTGTQVFLRYSSGMAPPTLSFLRKGLTPAYFPVRQGSGAGSTIELKMIETLNRPPNKGVQVMKRIAFALTALTVASIAVSTPVSHAAVDFDELRRENLDKDAVNFDELRRENLDKDAVETIQVKAIDFDELRRENLDEDAVDFDELRRENLDKDAVYEVVAAVDFDELRRENLDKERRG
ncbi:MAG: hypothetical protein F6J95_031520 [Leptolyngbya sp. SIO1E4]|nr:hypothetical protein [Leptolyngbya sp. SIO1E4]